MADPANSFAAASTSRKRALRSQLRAEAKRLRTASQVDFSSQSSQTRPSAASGSKVKPAKSKTSASEKTHLDPRSKSQEDLAGPTNSHKVSYSTRSARSDSAAAASLLDVGDAERSTRKRLLSRNSSPEPDSAPASKIPVLSRNASTHRNKTKSKAEEEKPSRSRSKKGEKGLKRELEASDESARAHKSRKGGFSGVEDVGASTSANHTYPQIRKYSLRSSSRLSSSASLSSSALDTPSTKPPPNPSTQAHQPWKRIASGKGQQAALGASASSASTSRSSKAHSAPNLAPDPPEQFRLTRSGAVLRRVTRSSKGQSGTSTTTGSCASSSSGGAATASGRRSASGGGNSSRSHKSSGANTAQAQPPPPLLPAPVSGARTMAADQSHPNLSSAGLQLNSEEPPSAVEGAQSMASSGQGRLHVHDSGPGVDSESDDSEVGRLQALLEARGLPPHLFGALGPRMQHLLHRSMGSNSSVAKAQALLPGLEAIGDEGQQLQAVIEMCQVLVMGNEEVLTGFPVKQVVPALIALLQMDHNFDIMNHACRALTYMMEALPRSSSVVVDAVPVFLEKLQVIQCMDVAEQSLTALDMLSRRHSKSILQARGVSACLTYLDFFPINAQRNAFSVTANCCLNLTSEEFQYVQESLSLLASRLTQQDKKCVESVCLAFSRLVDSYQLEPVRLQEIASAELLTNLQQLLVVTPPLISTGTFITVLRMLSVMCANCPDLALTLLKQSIAETLLYLLTGSGEVNQDNVELVSRQPQELFEITCLIGELMPKLPTDGIFTVDALLERPISVAKDQPVWQWRGDRGWWHPYGPVDSRIIESAHQNGDDEVSLNTLGRIYTVDFHSMQQINEDTGTSRAVQRLFTPSSNKASTSEPAHSTNRPSSASRDARVACLRKERGLAAAFIRSLFCVLYEVYSSSAGPAVRCKCLKALLRMVYYATPELLKDVLKNQVVSSHIAGMMASTDLRIVVGSLQMAEILMNKLPEEFGTHFRREGVLHQVNRLADPEVPLGASPPKSATCSATSFASSMESQPSTSQTCTSFQLTANGSAAMASLSAGVDLLSATPNMQRVQEGDGRSPSPTVRLGDVLKRKRTGKRSGASGGGSRSKTRQDDLPISPSLVQDFFSKAASLANSTTSSTLAASQRPRYSGSSSKTSFLQNLNPARWGRNTNSSHERNYTKDSLNNLSKSASNSHITAGNREKTRTWIREQANKFIDSYSNQADEQHPATTVLTRLKLAIDKLPTGKCAEALLELREILIESDISPFEVNYSGLIKALLSYLADLVGPFDRDQRIRIMLNVFADMPLESNVREIENINSTWMRALVAKLNGCVSQLEQFPVKVHDLPANSGAGRGGTSALKFFNTHQLKCNLQRHPDCNNLKQWKGGTVKIDPLALVQAIERYLIVRGYGRLGDKDTTESDDGDSDTDIDDTLAGVTISQTGNKHKLQFVIGNTVLPYNMTVYQAVRQFSNNGNDQSETDTDNETPLGNAGIWVQTHVIYYRPLREEVADQNHRSGSGSGLTWNHSSRKGKGVSGKSTSRRKGVDLWNEVIAGITPPAQSPLAPYLSTQLPDSVAVQDASLEVLCLLRILHAVNLYWGALYPHVEYRPILAATEFINPKIAAKASRQLQDPLVIMTGNLPNWLHQIATSCPFLFQFETRQLLFYATSFDRDRALQRLLDMAPELSSSDSQERVTPRLDRRKRTISREDILKQAEQMLQDLAGSKALLEVQYENEVGTGLGPTLEFYALVSKELQKHNLDLWYAPNATQSESEYVHNQMGLFPAPVARGVKLGPITKVKSKFRFLGKFMARAVMDSRMLDLPFSLTFYRWLLGHEHCLTLADLKHVSPDIYSTIRKMQDVVRARDEILQNSALTEEEQSELVEKLEFDGCLIDDLGLVFVVPGYNVELIKNGKNTHLTIHNLHVYVQVLTHWLLHEGVARQMEALREGFNSVFPSQNLCIFQPDELEQVFCGSPKDHVAGWDVKTLMDCCRPDHGYTADSKAIRFLFEVLSSYDREEQRMFVQFLTGSPRLPVGGFKALSPPLTVVRKTLEPNMNPDDFLPSVMTCVNYLKLPDYSSMEVMRLKLGIAASEGQHSFYLS
ncbi:E3 ubiquitin-protein ligase TRIP12 isoform X1 [Dendroctonus ponderosae]|uniref:E3 ubiquitin-protein ligase TRIP12 isoform X1 n=1 Tax=Dendroctonus ponderosae TaxID=77166 RepID=UPI002035F162|nr:E3 ubiquitin-protein ligase TRIP12 isoform X1 [Dendroctonus ponderosae]XP_048518530.1 E3 ubiquitin-protein ligase TRIP12 isoform X1 [Dendroctonus ponderosae]